VLVKLVPLDREMILALARQCNRVLIVHEDTRTGSIGESVAAIIQEEAFDYLDAPIERVGARFAPIPFAPVMEEYVVPHSAEVLEAIRRTVR